MLRLGERATRVPAPRQAGDRWNPSRVQFKVVVHGEVYNVWSLLEAGCSRSVAHGKLSDHRLRFLSSIGSKCHDLVGACARDARGGDEET